MAAGSDASGSEPVLRLEAIERSFRVGEETVRALAGVSTSVAPGEHVAIMGPSGSGKSTLLNILGCLDRPSAGRYWFTGREVGRLDDAELTQLRRHSIGFVFQFFHLVPRLTAAANVELPMLFAGVSRRERRERAAEALERVGLTPRLRHLPDQLSGGERQRVALARATVMNPALLLADEPTGNLDSRSGRVVLDLLGEMNDAGQTLVVVTHDPKVAHRADRVVVLVDGRIAREVPGAGIAEILSILAEEEEEEDPAGDAVDRGAGPRGASDGASDVAPDGTEG